MIGSAEVALLYSSENCAGACNRQPVPYKDYIQRGLGASLLGVLAGGRRGLLAARAACGVEGCVAAMLCASAPEAPLLVSSPLRWLAVLSTSAFCFCTRALYQFMVSPCS